MIIRIYDNRVATTYHNDSADSASVDSDHTHDPPGADETDPPDAQYHHSTDDEEPQPPFFPVRADPTDYQILGWISVTIPYTKATTQPHQLRRVHPNTPKHPTRQAPAIIITRPICNFLGAPYNSAKW
jgi:hypothetical protein